MKRNQRILNVVLAALFLWTSGVGMGPGYAQGAGGAAVVPTAAQLELNKAGVQAIVDENYGLAVQLFDSSLALGPINITYVNRGRAFQHAGKCEQAEESYQAAFSAPAMSEPSAENVAATIARYRAELQETCPGKVLLECEPQELVVSVDGQELGPCPAEPIELSKGEHQIRGTHAGRSVESVVDIAPMTLRRLSLRFDVSGQPAEALAGAEVGSGGAESFESVRPLVVEDSVMQNSGSSTAGYWLLGSGAALIAGGAMFELMNLETSNNQQFDAIDVTSTVLFTTGGFLAVYGILSLIN